MGLLVNHAQPKCLVRAPQGAGEAKHPPSINGIQILPRTCWKFQSLKGCVRACLLPYTHGCYYFGAEYPTKDYHMVVGGSNLPPPKKNSTALSSVQSCWHPDMDSRRSRQRLPSKSGHPPNTSLWVSLHEETQVVEEKLEMELQDKRMIGSFMGPVFLAYVISPLGLRAKKVPGKFWVIHDLSVPI